MQQLVQDTGTSLVVSCIPATVQEYPYDREAEFEAAREAGPDGQSSLRQIRSQSNLSLRIPSLEVPKKLAEREFWAKKAGQDSDAARFWWTALSHAFHVGSHTGRS